MKRSEAVEYMMNECRLKERTAREKIQECTQNPGKIVYLPGRRTIKAVPVTAPDRLWDFEIEGPGR